MNIPHTKSFTVLLLAALTLSTTVHAQHSGSNSSYSRFGLGLLSEQTQSYNASMGGVAQGLRSGNRINKQNPASYAAVDSLSLLFDAGISLNTAHIKQGNTSLNANSTSLDFVCAEMRLLKGLGLSIGFVPYSNTDYSFAQESKVFDDTYYNQEVTQQVAYNGSGSLHEVYLGLGWMPFKGFSMGFNVGYMHGYISHSVVQSFYENGTSNNSDYSDMRTIYTSALRTWNCDIGLQYGFNLNATNSLTLGATVGLGHTIPQEAQMMRYTLNADTITRQCSGAYSLPMSYSAGLAWQHNDQLTVAADWKLQKWSKAVVPALNESADHSTITYEPTTGLMRDRHRFALGAEYVPRRYDRHYLSRINYRIGAYYSTPYQIINGHDGPYTCGITAGLGLPITNIWNNRSYVNIGLEWTHRDASAPGMIREDIFGINISLTFNERWFMQWKFD